VRTVAALLGSFTLGRRRGHGPNGLGELIRASECWPFGGTIDGKNYSFTGRSAQLWDKPHRMSPRTTLVSVSGTNDLHYEPGSKQNQLKAWSPEGVSIRWSRRVATDRHVQDPFIVFGARCFQINVGTGCPSHKAVDFDNFRS
jgi:hypothetical protein